MIAQTYLDQSGRVMENTRVTGATRHETGHAVDRVLALQPLVGGEGVPDRGSAGPGFRAAYCTDVDRLKQPPRRRRNETQQGFGRREELYRKRLRDLNYFLQPGDHGPSETFAEAVGIVLGGGSSPRLEEDFRKYFSGSIRLVRDKIGKLR